MIYLVDKVDELWGQKQENKDLIIGLLQAAKECRAQIRTARIVVFLRSDIFDFLHFHDLDKYRSISERVTWNESSLLKLISLRINNSMDWKDLKPIYGWQRIFPKKVNGEASFSYLLQFTLMRPRDLIQICNQCKSVAEESDLSIIDKTSIAKALPEFSRWKLDDLIVEYKIQYPFLEKVFWNVFYRMEYQFDYDLFLERIKPRLSRWQSEEGGENFTPPWKLLDILYKIGFIGIKKLNGILFYYNGIPITITDEKEFVIHPAFHAALEIKESEKIIDGGSRNIILGDFLAGDTTTDAPPPPPPSS